MFIIPDTLKLHHVISTADDIITVYNNYLMKIWSKNLIKILHGLINM